jgi:hypothetical protein
MHSIWAVAKNTIAQAVRMKVAVIFIVLLITLLPLMGVVTSGDGTVKGKLQTFISYGLSLTNFLLCLITMLICCYSLSADIKDKQIFTIATKPIRRYQILLGKLLGVVLLDILLLAVFGGIIYALTIQIPAIAHADEQTIAQVNDEFFTARAELIPQAKNNVEEEIRQTYSKLEAQGELPRGMSREKTMEFLRAQKIAGQHAAAVGQRVVWVFENVGQLKADQKIFVKYKYDVSDTPVDRNVYGRWLIGDYRQVEYGGKMETPVYVFDRKDAVRTFQELAVPSNAVASDGYLAVVFENVPLNQTVVMFAPQEGLRVLYEAGTFEANFIRAMLVILVQLIFLAALGISISTCLSFPVGILICLIIFFVGLISGFILESFDLMGAGWGGFYKYTVRPIIEFLPRFDQINPTEYMISARFIAWPILVRFATMMIGLKAAMIFLFGIVIFRRRELAKITV